MEIQYYIQYILSWIYHNVLYTDATFAIIRILLFIGLVTLFVYREYVLFTVLCIIVISAECFRLNCDMVAALENMLSELPVVSEALVFDKDELTKGVPITREGFSLSFPKIIKGDDSGTDHRRSNKFIEEDSNDFTDKYFNSKQCSIGSGIGGISMFGSNELLEGTTRTTVISGIYDFENKSTPNNDSGNVGTRATYFIDCVYYPIKRSYDKVGSFRKVNSNDYYVGDFRDMKRLMYNDINDRIIDISRCLARFNSELLFNTMSDITAGISNRITLSDKKDGTDISDTGFVYKSLIAGDKNTDKMVNIQPLNSGRAGDNRSDSTYNQLLQTVNSDERYKNNDALKQRHLTIYSKAYSYRKRIDEILSMMRQQTKNDSALLYTIRVDEAIIQELRMMLGWLAIVQRTADIIKFEMELGTGDNTKGIYVTKLDTIPPPTTLEPITAKPPEIITGVRNIFKLPHDDDTYNSADEKRYLYGITYYFGGRPHRR